MAPKVIAAVLSLSSMLAAIPMNSAQAQEYQGCFMIDSSGRMISLSSMCGSAASSAAAAPRSSAIDEAAQVYAARFCQYRIDGYLGDESRMRAIEDQKIVIGRNWSGSQDALLRRESELVRQMCPQFVLN